jgi:hypothetical protein
MATATNNFEGGTVGSTITSGNSGGISGTAWNTVTIGAGASCTYVNSPVLTGKKCVAMSVGASAGVTQLDWRTPEIGTIGPVIYTRFYMMYDAWPVTTNNRVMYLLTGLGAMRAGLILNNGTDAAARKFSFADGGNNFGGTGGQVSTTRLDAAKVYRFEARWLLSTTVGQAIISVYEGHSTTPIETLTSTADQNFAGTTMGSPSFGYNDSRDNTDYVGRLYMDSIAIGESGYFGPVLDASANDLSIPIIGRGASW